MANWLNRHKVMILFIITCIICVFLVFLRGNIFYLNSDTASEIVQSIAIKETGSLFPEDWIAGSQFQLCSYIVWFFTLIVPGNLILARNLMQFVVTLLTFISIIALSKQVFRNNSGYLMIALCFCGAILQFNRLYVVYGEYNQAIVLLASYLILLFKSINAKLQIINKKCFAVSLMVAFFSCVIGTQGLQQICIPICGSLIIYSFGYKNRKLKYRALMIDGIVCGTCLLGTALYTFILSERMGVVGLNKLFEVKTTEELKNLGNLASQSFSIWINDGTLQENGIIGLIRSCIRIITSIFMIFVLPGLYVVKLNKVKTLECAENNTDDWQEKVYIAFALITLLEILGIFIVSRAYLAGHHVRYFVNAFCLLAIIGSACINKLTKKISGKKKRMAFLAAIVFVVFCSSIYWLPSNKTKENLKEKKALSDYLIENDLKYGYSSYWNASYNTALSNGQVQINNLQLNGRTIEPYKIFMLDRWFDPNYYYGQSFLLLSETEYENEYWYDFAYNICGNPEKELFFEDKHILIYDYNIARVMPKVGKPNY